MQDKNTCTCPCLLIWISTEIISINTSKLRLLDQLALNRSKTFRIWPSNVWFDDDYKSVKQLSRMMERKYHKWNLPCCRKDWIKQLHDYRKLCEMKSCLFCKCQIETGSANPKIMWRAIKTVLDQSNRPVQYCCRLRQVFKSEGGKSSIGHLTFTDHLLSGSRN